jgi:acyl homoserine lactone synthase
MFVERQKWSVPNYRHLEYDEFDTPAATYILTIDDQNRALGTTRLIPTTRPYMIRSLWPDLIDKKPPACNSIWEASRFGCDRDLDPGTRRCVIAQLILGCQEFGIANGISEYLGVMPTWIFKHVIAANGCPVTPIGPVLTLHGHEIAASYIGVSSSVLETVRRRTAIRNPVLNQKLALVA